MQPEQLGQTKLGEPNKSDSQSEVEPELIPRETGKAEQASQQEGQYIPKDVGNRLAGAPLGPANFGAGGTSDLRLLRRAARNGWDIPDELKRSVPGWLGQIVGDEELDVRGRVGAAKVLVDMDRANLEREKYEETGGVNRVDVTSGGKPLGQPDLSTLTDADLERLIAEKARALPGS